MDRPALLGSILDHDALFEAFPDPCGVLDAQLRLVAGNAAFRRTFGHQALDGGLPLDQALKVDADGQPLATHLAIQASARRALAGSPDTAGPLPLETIRETAAGRIVEPEPWTVTHVPLRSPAGEVAALLQRFAPAPRPAGTAAAQPGDKAEMRPEVRLQHLRRLFHQAPSFIMILGGPNHVVEFTNAAYGQLTNHREVVGMQVRDAFPEAVEQGYLQLLDTVYRTKEPYIGREARVLLQRRPGGDPDEVFVDFVYQPLEDETGRVTGIFVQGHEVTDQRRAKDALRHYQAQLEELVRARTRELEASEAKLRHAQKLEAVGKLTGGVAHDFNNLLHVIGGNLQLLERDLASNPRAQERVTKALGAVQRGAKLASQLLAFARRQPLEPRVFNIGRLVRGMDDLLRRSLGEGIEVETVVAGGQWNALADPSQMENAILNLAINARDAMDGVGKLTIETGNAVLDDQYAARNADVRPGQYVMIAITDTGCGMTPEVRERIFEPFFTTKPEGQGTGLGLAMVYGFVKQSGGHIACYSEVGQGTTFRIYLPRALEAEAEAVESLEGPIVGGNETILVVEDDPDVRETAVAMLRELGYAVLTASDAESALAVIRSGVPIDLLFTDVVMPGKVRSPDLARQAKAHLPDLEVLFTSGYTENAIVHGGRLDPGVSLLGKPYRREDLARKVRHLLRNRQQRTIMRASQPTGRTSRPQRILIVEDDADIRSSTVELVRSIGHEAEGVPDGDAALERLGSAAWDILLTDIDLAGRSGVELAAAAAKKWPALRVIFVSGYARPKAGAPQVPDALYLQKPYDLATLERTLEAARREDATGGKA
jgi:signal transduction histidine kinase/DNA-binding response OmpR family regulator